MNLTPITGLWLALLPLVAVAQKNTLKDQLVGTWAFVPAVETHKDAIKTTDRWGANPKGLFILTSNGRFSFMISRSDLPQISEQQQRARHQMRRSPKPGRLDRGDFQEIELGPQGGQKYPTTKLRVGDPGKSLPGLASFSPTSGASSACYFPRAVAEYQPPLPWADDFCTSRSACAIASLRFEYRYFP